MHYKFEDIKIESINTEDTFYKITTCNEIEELSNSIRDLGIINPPVLVHEKDQFSIVSGFRRIGAAIRSGLPKIQVKLINAPKESLACAKIAISDNSYQRKLNQIEQARAIHLLKHFYRSPKEISDVAGGLSLPANQSIIEKLITIAGTDQTIQDYILSDTLSMTTALRIDQLNEKYKIPIAGFIQSLNVSLNIQREILILLTEISKREDKNLLEILSEKSVTKIMNDDNMELKQKTVQIRKLLRMRRFPELVFAEDAFSDCVKNLKLVPAIKLTPPKDFEGTTYSLQIVFNSYKEILQHRKQFNEIIDNPFFKQLLK